LVAAALALMSFVAADASHLTENPKKHRVVYQLSDAGIDKARFVLGNIQNHVSGVGWDHIEAVELVVFGPALRTFVTKEMDPACPASPVGAGSPCRPLLDPLSDRRGCSVRAGLGYPGPALLGADAPAGRGVLPAPPPAAGAAFGRRDDDR